MFAQAIKLKGAAGGTEPRITVDPSGHSWLITNDPSGTAIVYGSSDGLHRQRTPSDPANQDIPSIDTDITATTTGRLVAVELDFGGINFRVSHSDDGGKTWTPSQGASELADTDRPYVTSGPHDRVYLLFHNLFSGEANHNMYVETSTDGGATFGPPVPLTLPGEQAYVDLQCADSGGPSNIFVNQRTGRVYAVWGTRGGGPGGGCQAAVQAPEINVVGATRVWVATSPDGSPGSWVTSLAVDDSAAGKLVGMQLSPGALDAAGNVYVFYPESPKPYPDYDGAAMRYVVAPSNLSHWSKPVTVAPGGGPGNVLPHVVAGATGKVDFAYYHGVKVGKTIEWFPMAAQTQDALAPAPQIVHVPLANVVTYTGTASALMGACGKGPTGPVENGLACGRSTDVWGIGLDHSCRVEVVWPSTKKSKNDPIGGQVEGTWVSTQVGGPTVC